MTLKALKTPSKRSSRGSGWRPVAVRIPWTNAWLNATDKEAEAPASILAVIQPRSLT